MYREQLRCNLTAEAKQFLDGAPLNAEEESSDEDPDEDEEDHPVHAPNHEDNRDLHSDDEDHPVELDWAAQSSKDFFRAPDLLGGDGGVAALQERWFPGFVVRHVPLAETNGFHLYEIQDGNGRPCGQFAKNHIFRREVNDDDDIEHIRFLRSYNEQAAVVSATSSGSFKVGKSMSGNE